MPDEQQLLAPPSFEIGLSYARLRSILKTFSGKSSFHARFAELIDENTHLLKRDMEQIDYNFILKRLRCKKERVVNVMIELYDFIADAELNSMEEIPRISETEFNDIIERFLKSDSPQLKSKKKHRKSVIGIITTDTSVMTGDTERINKTALCRESKLKSKEVDAVLDDLKIMFVEAEKIYQIENEQAKQQEELNEQDPVVHHTPPARNPIHTKRPISVGRNLGKRPRYATVDNVLLVDSKYGRAVKYR